MYKVFTIVLLVACTMAGNVMAEVETATYCLEGVVLKDANFTPQEVGDLCNVINQSAPNLDGINYVEYISDFPVKDSSLVIASVDKGQAGVDTLLIGKTKSAFVLNKDIKEEYEDFIPSDSQIIKYNGVYQLEATSDNDSSIIPHQLFRINDGFSRTAIGQNFEYYSDVNGNGDGPSDIQLVLQQNAKSGNLQLVFKGTYNKLEVVLGEGDPDGGRYERENGGDIMIELADNYWKIASGKLIKE